MNLEMDLGKDVQMCNLIVTQNSTNGDGVETPIRSIRQIYTQDGNLIGTKDPLMYTIEQIHHVLENSDGALGETDIKHLKSLFTKIK